MRRAVLGLLDLPVRVGAPLFELFAEPPDLVGERLTGCRPGEEAPDPANAVRRRLLCDQLSLEQKLAELLQRRLELTHDSCPLLPSRQPPCLARHRDEGLRKSFHHGELSSVPMFGCSARRFAEEGV